MKMKLIEIGKEYLAKEDFSQNPLSDNKDANDLLCNLKDFPHAFVLGCLMDFQIKAKKAWLIPYKVCIELNAFSMTDLIKIPKNEFERIFKEKRLHRFNEVVAGRFYEAIQKIHNEYADDASNIWKNSPKSADVVSRFRAFEGAGEKIATMAPNILFRRFKVPFADLCGIDISPDVHIRRVFKRMGYVEGGLSNSRTNRLVIKKARELYPDYPGIFDIGCWHVGKDFCHPKKQGNPECEKCPLTGECKKMINME